MSNATPPFRHAIDALLAQIDFAPSWQQVLPIGGMGGCDGGSHRNPNN